MSQNRVLFITRKWPPAIGGMETYCVELTKELGAFVDLDILYLPGRPDGRSPSLFKLLCFLLTAARRIWSRRGRYDLIHFGDGVLIGLAWWSKYVSPRTKVAITVHGLDIIYSRRPGLMPSVYGWYLARARKLNCVDLFIANSENTAKLASDCNLVPNVSIPLGVRVSALPPPAELERHVLFIGRLVPRKGAAWFATEVLPHLPADVKFVVVGKVWDQGEGNILEDSPRVSLLGFVSDDDLKDLKSRTPVIVMPNIPSEDIGDVEGFGLAALEAAASGVPLIASATEGLSDAVQDGVTGFLLPPQDPDAWVKKVEEILSWPAEQRGSFRHDARACLERQYSWRRVAADTCDQYARLLDEPT